MRAAAVLALRVREFLRNVQGQNAEEFAKDLGWPSSAALVEFLYDRANLGEMQ